MRRARWNVLLGLCLLVRGTALAADVSFSSSPDHAIILHGAGDAAWVVRNDGGTNSDGPTQGACDGSAGLAVTSGQRDATHANPIDVGLTVWMNGFQYVSPNTVDVTGSTLTSGPLLLDGILVTVRHAVMQDGATLRTMLTLENDGTSYALEPTVAVATNLATNAATVLLEESVGAPGWWRTTADDAVSPTTAVHTFAYRGPGNPTDGVFNLPLGTDVVTGASTFDCQSPDGVVGQQKVVLPPHLAMHLLYFTRLDATPAEGIAAAQALFDSTPARTSDLVADLTDDELTHVVNWNFFRETVLDGGAPGATTRWRVWNGAGASSGSNTISGFCDMAPGVAVADAILHPDTPQELGGGFHDGLMVYVDNEPLTALPGASTDGSLTVGPTRMGPVDVTVEYTALSNRPALRTLVTVTNPGDVAVTPLVILDSHRSTIVASSSDADTALEESDRWIVTSATFPPFVNPVVTHVAKGPGTIPIRIGPFLSGTQCPYGGISISALGVDVLPHATRRLLVFNELHATAAEATASAIDYDTNPGPGSPLLHGFDRGVLASIANWNLCSVDESLCDDGVACSTDTCSPAGVCLHTFSSSACDDGDACTVDLCNPGSGCGHSKLAREASVLSITCRLQDAHDAAQDAPARMRARLLGPIEVALDATRRADSVSGRARARLLRRASRSITKFVRTFRRPRVRDALPGELYTSLLGTGTEIVGDLRRLRDS